MGPAPLLLALPFLLLLTTVPEAQAANFTCKAATTCNALVDYVSPNTTSLSSIQTLFGVKNLRTLLGANNLANSTLGNYTVTAKDKVIIPFRCRCSNGTGASNGQPVYVVQSGDGLDHIAVDVFARLVTFQEIQAANNISNPNLIQVGQELRIPLPCSCDEVNGAKVVHYGHVVEAGSSVEQIAEKYNTTEATLLSLNGISDPKTLQAGAVLDVPLKGILDYGYFALINKISSFIFTFRIRNHNKNSPNQHKGMNTFTSFYYVYCEINSGILGLAWMTTISRERKKGEQLNGKCRGQ